MDIKNLVLSDAAVNLIDNGTWINDLPGAPGVELFVTGLEGEDAKKAMTTAQADARLKNEGKPVTAEQYMECTKNVLAEVCLRDWRGLTDGGAEVPYSKDLAKQWITSKGGERFAGLVLIAAQRVDANAGVLAEALAKN